MQLGGNGYAFAGGYGNKGCYAYNSGGYLNMAFYGTGGTEDQMSAAVGAGIFRPTGHDCIKKGILDS